MSPQGPILGSGPTSEKASFAYGESCLLGSPGAYSTLNLWAGKKAELERLKNGHVDDSSSRGEAS